MATVIKNTPIGITFPLRNGKVGYFEQSTDSFTAYRMNIANLLRTKQGERRMNPAFGSRLWTIVFEQNDDFVAQKVENVIREDVSQWIPGVTVKSVEVKYMNDDQSTDLRDIYKLYIVVKFVIDSINEEDSVELTLDVNKI
jgi:phage baseplate assembly protein W